MTKIVHYTFIAMMHLGLLLLPVGGSHAAVITVQAGQHQTWLGNNRMEANPTDTDTPMNATFASVYQEADWFDWPIYASDGAPLVDFQLVYDGRSVTTPEAPTWVMVIIGGLLISGRITIRRWQVVKG